MTKAPIGLRDLRRKLYIKAKTESSWRFWGPYVHVCKIETLRAAYASARSNHGAPGVDGVTFEAIEQEGGERFLEQIRDELTQRTYVPLPARKKEIAKDGGRKVRILSIPAICDRVVQGALKLILEPIFEADFQPGSYGYRPRRTAHEAIALVTKAIARGKTQVIDLDLRAFFDIVRQDRLLELVARRIQDEEILHLLKVILKSAGPLGVPQGGVISPLLSNVYLNEVDRMLERAKTVTATGADYTLMEYARFADDMVVLVNRWDQRAAWMLQVITRRLREEFAALGVTINEEKNRTVDLSQGESFGFLGFDLRRVLSRNQRWRPHCTPKLKKRAELMRTVKEVFRRYQSQPVRRVIEVINPILRGWVTYFAVGNSSRHFKLVKRWVELKVRRHLMRARKRRGFGWSRWSTPWIYATLGLFNGYRMHDWRPKASPA